MEEIKFEKMPVGIFDKVKTNKEEFLEKFIDELEELFPDTVKDGKVDFQALLERFGEYEDRDEKYELTWVGKSRARQESFEDIVGRTLKYIEEDSKNPETTENLYIEGDNLEVLKLLRNSYYGKIKMIYIDPPYNTGNDFIYKDDFTMTMEEYDKLNGDINEYGNRLVKNSLDSGRYHSNWLNMMYPRLQVAKDLLTDDGVIFISIGQAESYNLMKCCDEIYGEQNRVGIITRVMKSGSAQGQYFSPNTEYILSYAKNKSELKEFRQPISDEIINKLYTSVETEGDRKGQKYRPFGLYQSSLDPLRGCSNQRYYIEAPDGILLLPPGNSMPEKDCDGAIISPKSSDDKVWRWSRDRYIEEKKKGNIVFKKSKGVLIDSQGNPANWNVYTKIWLNDRQEQGMTPVDLIVKWENRLSKKELQALNIPFDFAKPSELIKFLISIVNNTNESIILDFFSGSATTAHAVMDLNAEDGGNRKFIMVQLPESTDEQSIAYQEGYKNICEIGKKRIEKAGEKIKNELQKRYDEAVVEDRISMKKPDELDTGFKVFRVEDTNFKRIKEIDREDLEDKYKSFSEKDQEDFNPHFTDLDVVYELMLRRQDIELTEEIKKLDDIGDRTYIVGDTMLVCLEEKITEEMVDKIGNIDTDLSWIVLRDSAFDDDCDLKVNTTRKLRTIIKESRKKDQKIYWI